MVNQKLIFHVVIFEKDLQGFLVGLEDWRLVACIRKWCRRVGVNILAAGAGSNHLHLLMEQTSRLSLQDWMGKLIGRIGNWCETMQQANIAETLHLDFGMFTVSYASVDKVTRFIETQADHHLKVSFEEEWVSLLDKHHVPKERLGSEIPLAGLPCSGV